MKFQKVISLTIVLIFFSLFVNCDGNEEAKNKELKEVKKASADEIDLNTQKDYEKVIHDLGITVFDGAVFNEVRKSDFYGNNIIEYSLPVGEGMLFSNAKQAEDSLISFYNDQFKSILKPKGWNESIGGDKNRLMYIKTGKKVKMFTVSIFTTFKENINEPKKFLFNYSE